MNEEQPEASPDEEEQQAEEPAFFDRALLLQPPEVRQEYFGLSVEFGDAGWIQISS